VTRTEKEQFISDLKERFEKAETAVAVAFKGLSVADATNLRKQFREGGVEYRVVKNTLAKRAAEGTDCAGLDEHFVGPTAVILSYDDVVAPAKILHAFLKDHEGKLTVKGGIVSGKVISAKDVEALSKMPGLPELRATMLALLNTPAQTLLRLVNTPGTQLAQVLQAKSEKTE
jgi:large subunit ribosomal protein L10